MFDSLLASTERQIEVIGRDLVEVLYDNRPKGSVTIGQKRNDLLEKADGEWVVFVDDDDSIPGHYVDRVCKALLAYSPDCVGYKIACTFKDIQGKFVRSAIAKVSRVYEDWYENKDGFDYAQMIYHKNPVRKALAMQVKFPDQSFAEDYDYAKRLKPLLKTEAFIDDYLYYYRFIEEPGGPAKRYPKVKK